MNITTDIFLIFFNLVKKKNETLKIVNLSFQFLKHKILNNFKTSSISIRKQGYTTLNDSSQFIKEMHFV